MRLSDRHHLEAESVAPPRSFVSEAWAGSSGPVRSLPPSAYTSLAFQAEEDAAIWTRAWVGVGFAADVANPGDVLPFTVGNHGIHVERLADGALAGRFNKAQHGGCRAVPLQCQTGTKTKCSFTACGYSRDRAPIAASDPDRRLHLDQYLGLRPERLLPVALRMWGPVVVAQLDPTADAPFAWPEATDIFAGLSDQGTTTWLEYDVNWKHLAVALAGPDAAGADAILFPNIVVMKTEHRLCVVVLQPTALSKTLCRLRVYRRNDLTDSTDPADVIPAIVTDRAARAEADGPCDETRPAKNKFDDKVMAAVDRLRTEVSHATLYRTTDKGGW